MNEICSVSVYLVYLQHSDSKYVLVNMEFRPDLHS